jgi:AcrR family transcriptional regulator
MEAERTSRHTLRRLQTRDSLLAAARGLIAEGRASEASIQEITDRADVGFGSFYNHFESKAELFAAAANEVLDRWSELFEAYTHGIDDPAVRFAIGLRLTSMLVNSDAEMARVIVESGFRPLDVQTAIGSRSRIDLEASRSSGRFDFPDTEIAMGLVVGGLLSVLRRGLADPHDDHARAGAILTEHLLRALGMQGEEARRLASLPLPDDPALEIHAVPPE